MDVRNLNGKTVLVTGAGSGIGKATALAFARRGASLVVCDIDAGNLEQCERELRALSSDVFARRVDVSSREDMQRFAEAVHARVDAVDLLVNNAGVGLCAGFLDTSLDDWEWIYGINVRGVIHGCHEFVPRMVARGRGGHVVNVASASAFAASETVSAYSTTKFAVLGLSEALRDELARHRIGVTAICPGIIDTAMTATAPMRGYAAKPAYRTAMIAAYRRRNYTPERVAACIVKAVQKNRGVVPVSPEAWFIYYLKRFLPGATAWITRATSARTRRQFETV